MLAHRGLQNLGRQGQKRLANRAHQHNGVFDKARDLGQQPGVGDNLQPLRKGLRGGVVPDLRLALSAVENDKRTFEFRRVVVERGDSETAGRHEAVALGHVAGLDTVNIDGHNLAVEDAQDTLQRPDPA
ncbi:hypothetical protein GALL_525390 [mine drainage metagenome]|uniref:Uncharacterized protein n=1 Tax=mine drainage metagenome TaxID=410659 RepID=A0A1J5P458_9ZZZZ